MFRTIALTIAYDGAAFAGWQIQANANSVQAEITRALELITKHPIRLTGASRTDSGVHALGQVAVFETTTAIPTAAFIPGLNSILPPTITILASRETAAFDPRRAASKRYRYLLHCAPHPYALLYGKVWHRRGRLDSARMHQAAQAVIGEHDFSALSASDDANRSKVRTMFQCQVTRHDPTALWPLYDTCPGEMIRIECEGSGFLKYMVRTLVGTLVEVGQGIRPVDTMTALLASRDRTQAGPCAPAEGLYLCQVNFGSHYQELPAVVI